MAAATMGELQFSLWSGTTIRQRFLWGQFPGYITRVRVAALVIGEYGWLSKSVFRDEPVK
jgi:hypothetical protein